MPGAGFLAVGPLGVLLFALTLAVFWLSIVAWFWAGMVVAPITVWLGSAALAGAMVGDAIWPPAPFSTRARGDLGVFSLAAYEAGGGPRAARDASRILSLRIGPPRSADRAHAQASECRPREQRGAHANGARRGQFASPTMAPASAADPSHTVIGATTIPAQNQATIDSQKTAKVNAKSSTPTGRPRGIPRRHEQAEPERLPAG